MSWRYLFNIFNNICVTYISTMMLWGVLRWPPSYQNLTTSLYLSLWSCDQNKLSFNWTEPESNNQRRKVAAVGRGWFHSLRLRPRTEVKSGDQWTRSKLPLINYGCRMILGYFQSPCPWSGSLRRERTQVYSTNSNTFKEKIARHF